MCTLFIRRASESYTCLSCTVTSCVVSFGVSLVQVTFQSVLARPLMSEDGETVEQAPGFKGAFMHGVARIAPDVEEVKGEQLSLSSVVCSLVSILISVCAPRVFGVEPLSRECGSFLEVARAATEERTFTFVL